MKSLRQVWAAAQAGLRAAALTFFIAKRSKKKSRQGAKRDLTGDTCRKRLYAQETDAAVTCARQPWGLGCRDEGLGAAEPVSIVDRCAVCSETTFLRGVIGLPPKPAQGRESGKLA